MAHLKFRKEVATETVVENDSDKVLDAFTHETIIHEPSRTTWRGYIWDSLDYPIDERRLMLKVDMLVVFWGALSSFIKYLDKSNFSNAYNSGLKEYLNVRGDEYNYANTGYNVASIICGYPCGWLMVRFNTKWFIMIIEILWTVSTFSFVAVRTPFQMIVLRVILGVVECGHYGAFVFLIGTYYNKKELARRQIILQSFTVLGPMFATYVQAGASSSLAGRDGYTGWQWTYFIDGIASVALIIPQMIFLPDILDRVRPNRFLSVDEIVWLKSRLPPVEKAIEPEGWRAKLKEMSVFLTHWNVWAFWLFGACQDLISLSNQTTQFWIKGWNTIKPGSYTVAQINTLTSPMYAVEFAFSIGLGWISDTWLRGKRWPGIAFTGLWTFPMMIALAAIPVYGPKAPRFFLYYQTAVAGGSSGLYWGYAQEYFAANIRERAFVTGGINVWAYIANSIVNPIWFKATEMPDVPTGHYISAAFSIIYIIDACALGFAEKYYMQEVQLDSSEQRKVEGGEGESGELERAESQLQVDTTYVASVK
ncbi:DEKNAAC103899 [Brettanomyces naardenensis]|uniref:DEKNAAC103899 n=1 Tax=Brettanomyces naardenensis TaxID=13370 RepID=A0A448YPF5_BRENA|nr:DEKNAAC103899 [Brettanomyces naardenensis]